MSQARRAAGHYTEEIATNLGWALLELDRINMHANEAGHIPIRRISMRLGYTGQLETLVTVAGWDDDGTPTVAFHSADTASGALRGAINRYMNGQLDWKEDAYYKG